MPKPEHPIVVLMAASIAGHRAGVNGANLSAAEIAEQAGRDARAAYAEWLRISSLGEAGLVPGPEEDAT